MTESFWDKYNGKCIQSFILTRTEWYSCWDNKELYRALDKENLTALRRKYISESLGLLDFSYIRLNSATCCISEVLTDGIHAVRYRLVVAKRRIGRRRPQKKARG